MTTYPTPDRLNRIEAAIEALIQAQVNTQQQIEEIDTCLGNRIEQLSQKLDEVARDSARMIGDLGQQIQTLSSTVTQQGQQAEQDRSQAAIDRAEFRSTVTQLLETLNDRFRSNGHS